MSRQEKIYTVNYHNQTEIGTFEQIYTGTRKELCDQFSWILEQGHKFNHKNPRRPRTINAFLNCVNESLWYAIDKKYNYIELVEK